MSDLNLPSLDIEDLDMDEIEESQQDELKDDAGGSLTYGIIGSGQGGGRMAKAFYDLGYTKTVAFNLAESDLKDHAFSKKAFEERSQEVFNKFKEIFGNDIDRIMICVGVGGGTGGGSVMPLLKIAKKYFTYIGVDNPNERVGVIASLPTTGECASPVVAENSYSRMMELCKSADKKEFAPLVIVDNDKIKKYTIKFARRI